MSSLPDRFFRPLSLQSKCTGVLFLGVNQTNGLGTKYGLDDQRAGFRFPAEAISSPLSLGRL